MVDANRLPGFPQPGAVDPGPNQPGPDIPDDSAIGEVEVESTGVAVDATGTTTIGTPEGVGGQVVAVYVDPTAADFSFNVTADGVAIFGSSQSPASTDEEAFAPPAADGEFQGDAPDLVFEVTSASGTGGATADVRVVTAVNER